MADSNLVILQQTGSSATIDTRTEGTNTEHRQVVVLGDPATNASVAAVASSNPASGDLGVVVRDVHGSGIASALTELPRVNRVFNLIDGTLSTITRVDRVHNLVDGTLSTVTRVDRVFNLVNGTISLANIQATAVIPTSVAGTASGVSVSGNTIVSPESGRNIKVYAFSLITTAQVHLAPRFTQGSGASPTELWRVALQAPSQGIAGANLAVTPPGYLFATGTGNTLALVLDSASLVHYSVGYFKESA